MNARSEPKQCPRCGTAIAAEAPQGLCPKCLLAQASIPTETGKGATSIPPTREELAAAFPQLEILELIGQGGMGFVFKARQPKLERLVALKILPQSFAENPAFADRFAREGRVLARLNHPNIVTIHDFGQANGFFYLLMEFVDGVNLRQAMRAGRFTPEQALAVVPRICDALQFAHSEGILHRDIKPENILLDSKGRVKIADFGIAKLLGQPAAEGHLTESGGTLGTPHYMAPEQIEKPATVDHRADIYSLGVVFYEMLTGELPIGKFQPPSQKVQVDVRLDEVVLHALEKEPARRYQKVSEVKTAVDTITSGAAQPVARGASVPPAGGTSVPLTPRPPSASWRPFAIGAGVALGTLILLLLLATLFFFTRATRARDQALREQRAARDAQMRLARPAVDQTPGELVINAEEFQPANPKADQMNWGFRVFVPPNHLASVLFVRWSNGVPAVEPGFSSYYKVGAAGGIDVPFCGVSSYSIAASTIAQMMTNAQSRADLVKWGISAHMQETNVVQWNVNLGLGFTSSRWMAMPAFHRRAPAFPQKLKSGHQLSFPLVEFDKQQENQNSGWSGIDLRFVLQPLREPAVRMLPNEKDMTNYVGGTGLAWPMHEALNRVTNWPSAPWLSE